MVHNMSTMYSTGKAAAYLGVAVKTLQKWDRQGRLKPERTDSGRRLYSQKGSRLLRPASKLRRSERGRLREVDNLLMTPSCLTLFNIDGIFLPRDQRATAVQSARRQLRSFEVVDERDTTRACSVRLSRGPTGSDILVVRKI
jgi:DNA-binding transcriptional MerR regulator